MVWRPADFYTAEGAALRCTLCPHACRLAAGETGRCRVRRRAGNRLETATFATSVHHLDPVERKPLYHYRPGTRVLTLAAPGCSFRCHYCVNYRLSQYGRWPEAPWRARGVDIERTVRAAADAGAAIGLSYSEPSLAAEMTLALAAAGHHAGVDVLWKTNGFLTPVALERLAPCLAAVNVDLKTADDRRHRALTGASVAPVLAALAGFVAAGVWVEVATPLVPGLNTTADELRRLAEAICRVSSEIPWHLVRFTPAFRLRGAAPTSPEKLQEARELAAATGLSFVYVERALGAHARHTHCPACGHQVVTRDVWALRDLELHGGNCARCDTPIAGRWR